MFNLPRCQGNENQSKTAIPFSPVRLTRIKKMSNSGEKIGRRTFSGIPGDCDQFHHSALSTINMAPGYGSQAAPRGVTNATCIYFQQSNLISSRLGKNTTLVLLEGSPHPQGHLHKCIYSVLVCGFRGTALT